jgi:hypothetical protein
VRYRVTLDKILGWAASCKPAGVPGMVQSTAQFFIPSRAGADFARFADSVGDWIWRAMPKDAPRPETVTCYLAVIDRNFGADVYVNELKLGLGVLFRRDIVPGDVRLNDIANVMNVSVVGVDIPPSAAFAMLFTVGWRRGLAVDITPISGIERSYDLGARLAQLFGTVVWDDDLAGLTEADWTAMFQAKWFPFSVLKQDTMVSTARHLASGAAIEARLDGIEAELRESLPPIASAIVASGTDAARLHGTLLQSALERFLARDWISCVSIITPRIEGVLRGIRKNAGLPATKKYPALIASGVGKNRRGPGAGWLLPDRFEQFLDKVVFAPFDASTGMGTSDAGRHSVGHGVADAVGFDRQTAMVMIMSFVQLLWLQTDAPPYEPSGER